MIDTSVVVDGVYGNCDFEVVGMFEGSNWRGNDHECEVEARTRKNSQIFGRCEGDASVEMRNMRWIW